MTMTVYDKHADFYVDFVDRSLTSGNGYTSLLLSTLVGRLGDRLADNHDAVGTFLSAYVGHLDVHREVLRLDALRPMLENNLDSKPSIVARRTFREWLIAGGEQIDRALDLTPGRGLKLLTRTHALTCGLWRQVEPGTIGDTAAGPIASSDFAHDLSEALAEYWRGALLS